MLAEGVWGDEKKMMQEKRRYDTRGESKKWKYDYCTGLDSQHSCKLRVMAPRHDMTY